jgi:hypothetical protein
VTVSVAAVKIGGDCDQPMGNRRGEQQAPTVSWSWRVGWVGWGGVAQLDVLSQHFDIREKTVRNSSDNVADVWWQRKGAVSSSGPTSRLLRIQALHQRHFRYVPLHDYIPGTASAISDDCSRLSDLTNSQLLAHFNSSFPRVGRGAYVHCKIKCTAH